jgi:hypothetical protein
MASAFQTERNRGTKEARQQLAVLREKWPIAFPADSKDVRPLAIGAAGEIAAAMDWSLRTRSACWPARPHALDLHLNGGRRQSAAACQAVCG